MLEKVKKAMRITVSAYDDELGNLIASAVATLQSLGITWATEADSNEPMAERAIITYCRLHFEGLSLREVCLQSVKVPDDCIAT